MPPSAATLAAALSPSARDDTLAATALAEVLGVVLGVILGDDAPADDALTSRPILASIADRDAALDSSLHFCSHVAARSSRHPERPEARWRRRVDVRRGRHEAAPPAGSP